MNFSLDSGIPIRLERYGQTFATCSVGGADLGEWPVRNGLALDWLEYSKGKYDSVQRDDEQAGEGYGRQLRRAVHIPAIHSREANCSDDANATTEASADMRCNTD